MKLIKFYKDLVFKILKIKIDQKLPETLNWKFNKFKNMFIKQN